MHIGEIRHWDIDTRGKQDGDFENGDLDTREKWHGELGTGQMKSGIRATTRHRFASEPPRPSDNSRAEISCFCLRTSRKSQHLVPLIGKEVGML